MKLINLTFGDLIKGRNLTFLVGAGCSRDPPSCLPTGREMMNSIIQYTCSESEIEKIKNIKELRFESLVEIVRDRFDSQLKIIDYYGECSTPNLQHYYFAEMAKKGHMVMTTNFDFLIEYALLNSNISQENIIPVITEEDFNSYSNPDQIIKHGKIPIYKIHGSTHNIVSGEETRDSLIATIQAFGSNKEGLNIFSVEPFKSELFDNISNNRTLVIIGYSGSDDFDIIPTIKELKGLKSVIWVNHINEEMEQVKVYEIKVTQNDTKVNSKVDKILVDLKKKGYIKEIYRVDTNTSYLIQGQFDVKVMLSSERFNTPPLEYLKKCLSKPDKFTKTIISYGVYFSQSDKYKDSLLKCGKEIMKLAEFHENDKLKASAFNNMALAYERYGDFYAAEDLFKKALKIAENINHFGKLCTYSFNFGMLYLGAQKLKKAHKFANQGLAYAKIAKDYYHESHCLLLIGEIYSLQGNYFNALEFVIKAQKIADATGRMGLKTSCINALSGIYYKLGNYEKALDNCKLSYKILEELRDWSSTSVLVHMANIYIKLRRFPEAINTYLKCQKKFKQQEYERLFYEIYMSLGNICLKQSVLTKAEENFKLTLNYANETNDNEYILTIFNNIGNIYYENQIFSKALDYFEIALNLSEDLNDNNSKSKLYANKGKISELYGKYEDALDNLTLALEFNTDELQKADILTDVAKVYYEQGEYLEAEKRIKEAYKIDEVFGNIRGMSHRLNSFGMIYKAQKRYDLAIREYKKALRIDQELKDLPAQSACLNNIGRLYHAKHKLIEALNNFKKSIKISEEINDRHGIARTLNNIALIQADLRKFSEAEKNFLSALHIIEEIGLTNSSTANKVRENLELLKELMKKPVSIKKKYYGRKVGRNEQCPCGSGKKYKFCCGKLRED